MIWYKFYLGDYIIDTNHLSDAEDLAYRRLMDMYYTTEREIPLDLNFVSRKIRLDLDITQTVLEEFFVKTETGYFNARCDAEIAKYQSKVAFNQKVGKMGGRPKSVNKQEDKKEETQTVSKENLNQIQIQKQIIKPSSRFNEFWTTWPTSKRKVGKSACEKKWKIHRLDEIAELIISNVKSLKTSEQWTTGYEPAPMTYINQRRWEDTEPSEQRRGI